MQILKKQSATKPKTAFLTSPAVPSDVDNTEPWGMPLKWQGTRRWEQSE